jgi:hypothetical protein
MGVGHAMVSEFFFKFLLKTACTLKAILVVQWLLTTMEDGICVELYHRHYSIEIYILVTQITMQFLPMLLLLDSGFNNIFK